MSDTCHPCPPPTDGSYQAYLALLQGRQYTANKWDIIKSILLPFNLKATLSASSWTYSAAQERTHTETFLHQQLDIIHVGGILLRTNGIESTSRPVHECILFGQHRHSA